MTGYFGAAELKEGGSFFLRHEKIKEGKCMSEAICIVKSLGMVLELHNIPYILRIKQCVKLIKALISKYFYLRILVLLLHIFNMNN